MVTLDHRRSVYDQLFGKGLEIGALHEPAPVPSDVTVQYFDAVDENGAKKLFPEIEPSRFVKVDFVGDLDREGLSCFEDSRFDFVVINHVLEHLSNPIRTVQDVFRVLKPGGIAVIAIPDKEFTFDSKRQETTYAHLWSDYELNTQVSDDDHYLDFLKSAAPHVFDDPVNVKHHVERARARREHAHVWTSASFRAFLAETFRRLSIPASLVYEITGERTRIEYFSGWRKTK